MVANELGFRQTLPQKRDSVIEDQIIDNKSMLEVPQFSISRSASPILEAMSARLTSPATGVHQAMDSLEDPPLLRMGARISG
jgi:glucosamine-6-phosphate deaminase